MSTLRRAHVLRAIFELGSFSVSEVAERTGEEPHYIQNLIGEYAETGFLSAVDKIRLRKPGPPQKVWVLEPSMQGQLLEQIAPSYPASAASADAAASGVGATLSPGGLMRRTEPNLGRGRKARPRSIAGRMFARKDDESVIAYHFVETEGSDSEYQSTTVEIRKQGDYLAIKDVLNSVFRAERAHSTEDRVVMLDEGKIASGVATLYSCLHKRTTGIIVHLGYTHATFTIAAGEQVEFSRTRRFSKTLITPEVNDLWRKLAGTAAHFVLKSWSEQGEKVFATVVEGIRSDVAFFLATYPDRKVTNILLSGIAPVYSVDLVKVISEKFGIPCEASDPLRVIRCDSIEDVVFVAQNPSGPISKILHNAEDNSAGFQSQLRSVYKSAPLIGYAIRNLGKRTPTGAIMPPKSDKPAD